MSEETQPESGHETVTESGDAQEIKVNRSAEDYAKRVVELSAENKRFRESNKTMKNQMSDLETRVKEYSEKSLKEQGKFQEAYEATKKDLESERAKRTQEKQAYAYKVVSSQLGTEAAKLGCLNTDALIKLASAEGLINDLEVDENFEVSQESLKVALDKAQREHHYLFGKPTPSVKDGVPGSTKPKTITKNDLSSIPMEKLIDMAKRIQ